MTGQGRIFSSLMKEGEHLQEELLGRSPDKGGFLVSRPGVNTEVGLQIFPAGLQFNQESSFQLKMGDKTSLTPFLTQVFRLFLKSDHSFPTQNGR